jgi:hypothetical protein
VDFNTLIVCVKNVCKMEILDNLPDTLKNQVMNLGKNLDIFKVGPSMYLVHDPVKDDFVGHYSQQMDVFIPNYDYFMILEYLGFNNFEEYMEIFNKVIIPNIGLPEGATMKPDYKKDKRTSNFMKAAYQSHLEKGTLHKWN